MKKTCKSCKLPEGSVEFARPDRNICKECDATKLKEKAAVDVGDYPKRTKTFLRFVAYITSINSRGRSRIPHLFLDAYPDESQETLVDALELLADIARKLEKK